jgi:20S proteasome alpha/beta subunit
MVQAAQPIFASNCQTDYPKEITDMSLIVAATNGKIIAVAADTLAFDGDQNLYRAYHERKIRVVDGRWVAGVTGDTIPAVAWDYFEANHQSFNPDIRIGMLECTAAMGEVYKKFRLTDKSSNLLAGFSSSGPHIYDWRMSDPAPQNATDFTAIGCGIHVARHFMQRCQPMSKLTDDQLVALVYFSVSEVAAYEIRVRKPIDVAIVSPSGAEILEAGKLEVYEAVSKRFASHLYGMVTSFSIAP